MTVQPDTVWTCSLTHPHLMSIAAGAVYTLYNGVRLTGRPAPSVRTGLHLTDGFIIRARGDGQIYTLTIATGGSTPKGAHPACCAQIPAHLFRKRPASLSPPQKRAESTLQSGFRHRRTSLSASPSPASSQLWRASMSLTSRPSPLGTMPQTRQRGAADGQSSLAALTGSSACLAAWSQTSSWYPALVQPRVSGALWDVGSGD